MRTLTSPGPALPLTMVGCGWPLPRVTGLGNWSCWSGQCSLSDEGPPLPQVYISLGGPSNTKKYSLKHSNSLHSSTCLSNTGLVQTQGRYTSHILQYWLVGWFIFQVLSQFNTAIHTHIQSYNHIDNPFPVSLSAEDILMFWTFFLQPPLP